MNPQIWRHFLLARKDELQGLVTSGKASLSMKTEPGRRSKRPGLSKLAHLVASTRTEWPVRLAANSTKNDRLSWGRIRLSWQIQRKLSCAAASHFHVDQLL